MTSTIVVVGAAFLVSGAVAARGSGATSPTQAPLPDNQVGRLFDLPLPGLSSRTGTPTATGNDGADARIRDLAVRRGYQLHGEPLDPMGSYQGRLLQQRAIDDLVDMQSAMIAETGASLTLTSGQRSADHQRSLFLSQLATSSLILRGRLVGNSEIALGLVDDVVHHALGMAAPPGFSRHHTGLVIDVKSQGLALFAFASSTAYAWLTEDNYANAMAYGWIPSYPPQASAQGPNPEPWEWAWIGRDAAACARAANCATGGLDQIDASGTTGWATTPDGTRPVRLRLLTAEGRQRLTPTWVTRFDVAAAVGVTDAVVGFLSSQGLPEGTKWACVEARGLPTEPWSRIGCTEAPS